MTPPDEHLSPRLAHLKGVAHQQIGEHWIDQHRRNIPDHWHAHARRAGGFVGGGR